jgi:antiviral defense system Shedu protein SduA
MVRAAHAAYYLTQYAQAYVGAYQRMTAPLPRGGGYPPLPISPYLEATQLSCYLANDGAVLLDSREPEAGWHIAGGPAVMVDEDPSRVTAEVKHMIDKAGLTGQMIGIYRIVAKEAIPKEVWDGELPPPTETATSDFDNGGGVSVSHFDLPLDELLKRLTFGAFGAVLTLPMPPMAAAFWNPRTLRGIGFVTADRSNRRFFHYCEVIRHVEDTAWDPRSISVRVASDIRRDYAWTVASLAHAPGGTITFLEPEVEVGPPLFDRITAAEGVIAGFETLLREQSKNREEIFHEYVKSHPILLDVYAAQSTSKPRWQYPEREQRSTKKYVEPDFVLQFGGDRYCLVELEKPAHSLKGTSGEPLQAVAHAAFQIAEWREFVSKYPDALQPVFPGLRAGNYRTMVVIGRTNSDFSDEAAKSEYLSLLRNQFQVDDIFTYDDLAQRARLALARLAALGVIS